MKIKLPESKHKLGYTEKEVLNIIKLFEIPKKTFWKKFGINTCAIGDNNEILYYGYDIQLAIRCCLEHREKTSYEWD